MVCLIVLSGLHFSPDLPFRLFAGTFLHPTCMEQCAVEVFQPLPPWHSRGPLADSVPELWAFHSIYLLCLFKDNKRSRERFLTSIHLSLKNLSRVSSAFRTHWLNGTIRRNGKEDKDKVIRGIRVQQNKNETKPSSTSRPQQNQVLQSSPSLQ